MLIISQPCWCSVVWSSRDCTYWWRLRLCVRLQIRSSHFQARGSDYATLLPVSVVNSSVCLALFTPEHFESVNDLLAFSVFRTLNIVQVIPILHVAGFKMPLKSLSVVKSFQWSCSAEWLGRGRGGEAETHQIEMLLSKELDREQNKKTMQSK